VEVGGIRTVESPARAMFSDETGRFLLDLFTATHPSNAQALERLREIMQPGTHEVRNRRDGFLAYVAEYIHTRASTNSRGLFSLNEYDEQHLLRKARQMLGIDLSMVPVRIAPVREDVSAMLRDTLIPRLRAASEDGRPLAPVIRSFLDENMRLPHVHRRLRSALDSFTGMLRAEAPDLVVPYLLETEFGSARIERRSAQSVFDNLGFDAARKYMSAVASGDGSIAALVLEAARVQASVRSGNIIEFLRRYAVFAERFQMTTDPRLRAALRDGLRRLNGRPRTELSKALVRAIGPNLVTDDQQRAFRQFNSAFSHVEEAISDLDSSDPARYASALRHLAGGLEQLHHLDRTVHTIRGPATGPNDPIARWERRRDTVLRTALTFLAGYGAGTAAGAGSSALWRRLLAVPAGVTGTQVTDYLITGNSPTARAILINLGTGTGSAILKNQIESVLGFRLW
jgi:hypothetical protein